MPFNFFYRHVFLFCSAYSKALLYVVKPVLEIKQHRTPPCVTGLRLGRERVVEIFLRQLYAEGYFSRLPVIRQAQAQGVVLFCADNEFVGEHGKYCVNVCINNLNNFNVKMFDPGQTWVKHFAAKLAFLSVFACF